MYEQFKNEFLNRIASDFSVSQLSKIEQALNMTARRYKITKQITDIVVYNGELPNMVKEFLVCKKIEGFSDGTLYNYQHILHSFFLTLQKPPEIVTTNDIRVFLYRYQKQRNISNRTLEKYREYISSFYNWACDERYLNYNPVNPIKAIKFEVKPRRGLSQIELEYLRAACATKKERAIIEIMYSTGCRVSELSILQKHDIDWDKKEVHLFGKGQKHRTSFLNAKAEVALRAYLDSRTDTGESLFVSDRRPYAPIHKAGIEKIVRNIAARASASIGVHVTPHVLRHTTATTAIENGMPLEDISKLLGHSNINTTLIYVKTTVEHVKAEHKRCVV